MEGSQGVAYSRGPQPPAQDRVCWEMLAHRAFESLSPGLRAPEGQIAGTEDVRGPHLPFSGIHHLASKSEKLLRPHYSPVVKEPHQLQSTSLRTGQP